MSECAAFSGFERDGVSHNTLGPATRRRGLAVVRQGIAARLAGKSVRAVSRNAPSARCVKRVGGRRRSPQPKLFHSGADFSLQLPGRDHSRERSANQRTFSAGILPMRHGIPETPGARLRGRLHRHFFHRGDAQRLALRRRLALSLHHAAVRLFPGQRSTPDLSPPAHRPAHFPPAGKVRTCATTEGRRGSGVIFMRCRTPSKF